MKRFLILALTIAILGGCAVVPVGYPVHEHAYRDYHGYGYDDGYRWHDGSGPHWRYDAYRR
jgi:hypothetical protein